jgi:membrane-associated phospholipid phosphatase
VTVDQAGGISLRHRLATLLARVLAPVPLGVALLGFVGWRSASHPLAGVGWGVLAACFAAVLPYGITHRLRAHRPNGGHASWHRVAYLAVALASAATGITLLRVLGAPPRVTAATETMVVGLLASLLVNTKWAISNHTAAAAGGAVILSVMVGPLALVVLAPLVVALAWARVVLHKHTPSQAVAGIALGAAVAAVMFPLLT